MIEELITRVFCPRNAAQIDRWLTCVIAAIYNLLQGLENVYMSALYKLKNLS